MAARFRARGPHHFRRTLRMIPVAVRQPQLLERAAFLGEQRLGGLANGLAVIDDENFQTLEMGAAVVHTQTSPEQTKSHIPALLK